MRRVEGSRATRLFLGLAGLATVVTIVVVSQLVSSTRTGPPLALSTSAEVTVPVVVGLPQAAAETLLQVSGLKSSVTIVTDAQASGVILTQDPSAGTSVTTGTAVVLTAASGSAPPVVPDVSGQTLAAATAALQSLGFVVKGQSQVHSSTVPKGDVVSTNPDAGTTVADNATISMIVSSGPAANQTQSSVTKPISGKPESPTQPPAPQTTEPSPSTSTTSRPPPTTTTRPTEPTTRPTTPATRPLPTTTTFPLR